MEISELTVEILQLKTKIDNLKLQKKQKQNEGRKRETERNIADFQQKLKSLLVQIQVLETAARKFAARIFSNAGQTSSSHGWVR